MINLILLAAGLSTRFGENKLLYKIDGIPMYRHTLDSALWFQKAYEEAHPEEKEPGVRIILVTAYEEIRTGAEAYGDITLVSNRSQEAGISHSIRLGIEASSLCGEGDSLMFAVCDQPYLTGQEFLNLAEGFLLSGKGIGCLGVNGVKGNPVIFNRKYREELLLLSGDKGGKQVVKRHEDDVFFCEAFSPLALKDVDKRLRKGTIP